MYFPGVTFRSALVFVMIAVVALTAPIGLAQAAPSSVVRIGDLVPANGATVGVGQDVVLSGFVETDSGIGIVKDKPDVTVEVDGEPVNAELVVGSKALNVAFRATATFAPGPHILRVTAHDVSGQTASSETRFTAFSPVRISGLVPPTGAAVGVGRDVMLMGSIESDHDVKWVDGKPDVTVKLDGSPVTVELIAGTNTKYVGFRGSQTFAAGPHTLSVTGRDVTGQSATVETRFSADTSADVPTIKITDLVPPNGSTVAVGQDVNVSGYVEAEAGVIQGNEPLVWVEVDGTPIAVELAAGRRAENVRFQGTHTFAAGDHTLGVTAVDTFGQTAKSETKFTAGAASDAAGCQFTLGFAKLQSQISGITGQCVTNEFVDKLTGDTLQLTTGADGNGGLLVFRRSDNHVAYTDGYQTWALGPEGFVERPRLNTERYPWEKERLTPKMLLEGTYHLPIGLNGAEVTFKLADGMASFPNPVEPKSLDAVVVLPHSSVWYGDFDGDGYRDAVAVIEVYVGGSSSDRAAGTGLWAVPLRDVDGQAIQLGHEFLGDRVSVAGIALGHGEMRTDVVPWEPDGSPAKPTTHVTKTFAVQLP